jgi:hypothetical protein
MVREGVDGSSPSEGLQKALQIGLERHGRIVLPPDIDEQRAVCDELARNRASIRAGEPRTAEGT